MLTAQLIEAINRQTVALERLTHNIERMFIQGYAVDGAKEAATTRALEFAQFKHDLANAKTEEERKKIRKAWNARRDAEIKRRGKHGT